MMRRERAGAAAPGEAEMLALLLVQISGFGDWRRREGPQWVLAYRELLNTVGELAVALGTTYPAVLAFLRRREQEQDQGEERTR